MNNEQTQTNSDDPSGPGWRDVEPDEILQTGDMFETWCYTTYPGLRAAEGGGGPYRRRIEPQQAINPDDPSGDGWRDVEPDEILQAGDMSPNGEQWERTGYPGLRAREGRGGYRRRIEPQQPEPQPNQDDPSGEGWRWVEASELLRDDDMQKGSGGIWRATRHPGQHAIDDRTYRRRIEPQQPSGSNPETMEDLRRRLAECEVLLAEAERSGQQVNAELQQLREQVQALTTERDEHARKLGFARECAEMSRRQVQDEASKIEQLKGQVATLTRERDRYRNQLAGAIEHSKAPEAQAQLVDRLQKWLRPVLELVAENPEDCGPLAVSVLGYLPGIASRLIEE